MSTVTEIDAALEKLTLQPVREVADLITGQIDARTEARD